MSLNFTFSKSLKTTADTAIIFVHGNKQLGDNAKDLDKKANGALKNALKNAQNFKAALGETFTLPLPSKTGFERVTCLGLGKASDLTQQAAQTAGGKLYMALESIQANKAALIPDALKGLKDITDEQLCAHIATGMELRSYKFEKYKSKKSDAVRLEKISVIGELQAKAQKIFKTLSHVNSGVFLARDLVNEPPNTLYPEAYAKLIKDELKPLGVEVEILDEKKMKSLKMGAILAVGMGSARPPRMVIMRWKGSKNTKSKTNDKNHPLGLIGKGVTFDTGGISIKPGAGMDEMKMDMGGSAAVVGTMKAIALRKSSAHVVGIVGLAENMPSRDAYRPGDIVTSYSGKTIEVLNTDAEGRLVLADCLTYIQEKYKPKAMIDLATLTGAMMVALGHEYCGSFVNNDKLWRGMEQASAQTGEKLWRMPLDPLWRKEMESQVADLQNLGKSGRYAGACTAAGFLEHFIEDGTPWAHMDIAGTAWTKKDQPTTPKFGSGFGVRVLDTLIANQYE